MAYLGLARKWRPQTFEDLVGQAHIARTISNAIKAGRINPGYLFTGTRGIGKTSAARIFAKALRCKQTKEPGIPCNSCTDCTEISEGNSVDVREIDGASNNGVDHVREIRENAKYLPSTGKHKIYIIDEVHMLTTAAFNALLKTLEEPPAHVIFIFATTDPQKIPATVLSRCQRFDFKRVSQKDLSARLKQICDTEKVEIAPDALATLAREAEGSMRDAVSLLDQILAVGGTKITNETVTDALGLVDKRTILDCVTGILKQKPLDATEAVGKVYLHGFDLKQFGREILRYLRQIMVARLLEDNARSTPTSLSAYMDISDVDIDDLRALIHERSLEELDLLFRMLNHGLEDVARSSIPKMVMDVLVIKMASGSDLISISDLNGPSDLASGSAGSTNTASGSRSSNLAGLAGPAELAAPKVQVAPTQPTPATLPAQLDASSWSKVIAAIKEQRPLIGSILDHLSLESVVDAGSVLTITLGHTKDHSFYREQLQTRAYAELLSQLLKNHLGRAVRLDYKEVLSNRSVGHLEQERNRAIEEQRRQTVLESEAFRATQQLLGAKLEKLDLNENS